MFAVMWSEHCGYKYSRPVLSYFRRYKEALDGEGHENAGIVDIGDGIGITMKVESHNHPSAVEPYEGAATGVGGILRDIFTMGARPIASLNSLRFGPLDETEPDANVRARNHYLFRRVVAGIGGYGNCVGVPTVGGEVAFHRRYSGNPLVNAMAVGLVQMGKVATAAAAGIGNPVVYLGSATGKDGIHGATFASDALSEDSDANRPNVQIGDPFAEKLLIEATLEALETGAVVAIQDMGAAGLTCSTVEMSAKGGVGMEIFLDKVPTREAGMSAYEMMLSESQERMLAVTKAGRQAEVIRVYQNWGLHAVEIGSVTDSGLVRVWHHGDLAAEVPAKGMADSCPTYTTEADIPAYHLDALRFSIESLPVPDLREALIQVLSSPNIASKRWVSRQYDQHVQTQTVFSSGKADAAVLAPRGTKKGIALAIDGNGRWTYLDPYVGGQLAVAEAARNVACTGARPKAVTDGLNFGNPQLPHVYWQFERAVRGIADAAEALGTPVISGNVSFYNESEIGEVLPTPLIGMLGVLEHAERAIPNSLPQGTGVIGLVWTHNPATSSQGLGASEYLAVCHGIEDGTPVAPHLAGELALAEFLAQSAEHRWLLAAHDLSEGGLGVAAAEMALANLVGCQVAFGQAQSFASRDDARVFGEVPGQVLIAAQTRLEELPELAASLGLSFEWVGEFDSESSTLRLGKHEWNLKDLRSAYEGAIDALLDAEDER